MTMKKHLENSLRRAMESIELANKSYVSLINFADNEQPGGTNWSGVEASLPYLESALKDGLEAVGDIQQGLQNLEFIVEVPIKTSPFLESAIERAIRSNEEAREIFRRIPDKKKGLREWPDKRKQANTKVKYALMRTTATLRDIQKALQEAEREKTQKLSLAAKSIALDLRKHLDSVKDEQTVGFIEEAITCFENGLNRAAVVLSWIGTVSLLHKHVVQHHLAQFNAEAMRRDSKWRDAKTADDLGRMKERDFLDILEYLSIIGKNVKQQLQEGLNLRNSCGHPSSLAIGQHTVAKHLETLILNVFSEESFVK